MNRAAILIFALLFSSATAFAAAKNVIVFFVNGANQAQLEFARQVGTEIAGMSNLSALPVGGTLLPLPGAFQNPALATINAALLGRAEDGAVGGISSGEELDSVATLARLRGKRVGIVSDGELTGALPGAFYAHESLSSGTGAVANWLPLCDFNFLAGEVVVAPGEAAEDRIGSVMARLGYRNVLDLRNLTPPVSRLFIRHRDQPGRVYAWERASVEERDRMIGYVSAALKCLDNRNGFFLAADFSNVARAGLENDSSMLLRELWLCDRALGEALRFFKEKPEDTLLIVVSLYDAGEFQLSGEPGPDFPVGPSRMALLAELNRSSRSFDKALELLGAGELFAPGAVELRLLHRLYFNVPHLEDGEVAAVLRSGFGIAPETPLRDYREWIDRVLSLRDRHLGARWGSKRVVTSLLPVLAIGQGASAFSGEYTLEEFSSRLREAVGLL